MVLRRHSNRVWNAAVNQRRLPRVDEKSEENRQGRRKCRENTLTSGAKCNFSAGSPL